MSNAELASLIKRNPLRVACVVLALLSGAGVYFVNGQIEDATKLLEQKTAEGSRLAANVKNAAQLPEQLEMLTSAVKKIQGRLIRGSQLATNLQYFYRLETDSGVELIDLRQTSGTQPTKANAGVGFAIAVKADYVTVLGCLRRLENGTHYCRVMTAAINGAGADRTGPVTLSLSLELLGQP